MKDDENKPSEEEESIGRRSFLKKAGIGAAGLGAASLISPVSALDITTNKGLEVFNRSNGESNLNLSNSGNLKTDQIGSSSNPVEQAYFKSIKAERVHSNSQSPNITVYEDENGRAKAVAEHKTYSGEDVFDAAQKAIDARLDEDRPGAEPANWEAEGDSGDIHIQFKPGYYSVSNRIVINQVSTERITFEAPGELGAWFDTSEMSSEKHVIEINPGPLELGDYSDRMKGVCLKGIMLDHTKSDKKDMDGLYITDTGEPYIRNCRLIGFGNALWIRNTWQGGIDNLWVNRSGRTDKDLNSNISGKPQIVIGAPSDTKTHEAVNHLSIRHLQGDPAGMENTYFATYGRQTKCSIVYANVELNEQTGFEFNAESAWKSGWKIVNSHIPGGDPTFQINAGNHNISNSEIGKIKQDQWAQTLVSNCIFVNDGTSVDVSKGRFYATGILMKSPQKGFDFQLADKAVLSNITLSGCKGPALTTSGGCQVTVNGMRTEGDEAHVDADYVIDHGSGDGSLYSNVVAGVDEGTDNSDNAIPLIRVSGVKGVSLNNLVAKKNITEKIVDGYGTVERYSNKGEATISSGNTSVTVDHKLVETPKPRDISVTPTSGMGKASSFHVSNIAESSFDIVLDSDPEKQVNLAWQADL